MTADALRACAEILSSIKWDLPARCNVARCGRAYCGRDASSFFYAGQIPISCFPEHVTAALTALPGSPADPRQRYDTAFDNPSMMLHIIGDDLTWMDSVAEKVIKLDMSSHITTQYGIVNGIRINPAKRTVRNDRPRYVLQMIIDMEMVRA